MINSLGFAAWDLESFFENAAEYAKTAGGALLILMGVIAVIWGAVKLVRKLMGGQGAQQESWLMIALLIIVGGALATGGYQLMNTVSSGGQQTIEDLGGAIILMIGR